MDLFGLKKDTLAIIGNGFDIAHGYKTDYRSFVNDTKDEALDKFKEMCDNEELIQTWYNFEENIAIIMTNFYSNAVNGLYGYQNVDIERLKIKEMYERISMLLFGYLKREMETKQPKVIKNIEKYIGKGTQIINFNYTNIANIYSKYIFQVHGSLDENDILLGYDYKVEPCLSTYLDMYWWKSLRRERLEFNRLLRKMKISEKRKQILENSFERYQEMRNSGRGIDDESKGELSNYYFLTLLFNRRLDKLPSINYKKIHTIVVLGHGIEADRVYLDEIFKRCINTNKIILFTYATETRESLSNKRDFLRKYCENIVIETYI